MEDATAALSRRRALPTTAVTLAAVAMAAGLFLLLVSRRKRPQNA
jgi:hypothetical protein